VVVDGGADVGTDVSVWSAGAADTELTQISGRIGSEREAHGKTLGAESTLQTYGPASYSTPI